MPPLCLTALYPVNPEVIVMDFEGKNAIVTGGANGIGRCITEEFIKAGASVAIIDADETAGKALAEKYAEKIFFAHGDIAEENVCEHFARLFIKRFGGLDFLINNAGLSRRGLLSGCGYANFNYALRVGVSAPYYLSLFFKSHFNPAAAIVNIASTRAFMSQPDSESYAAAKGGIVALTHAMAISLAGRVRVNSISPGWIDVSAWHLNGQALSHNMADHQQNPTGRIGRPEDVAHMALYLCSEKAEFITGENIVVDGGMTRQMIYHGEGGWHLETS